LRECPICIIDFDVYDEVIGLKCSNLHIYHKECIKNMVKQGETKCCLCRSQIELQR
jgi:NADH/NAD ratio-sensing transcriptional regulator Rex